MTEVDSPLGIALADRYSLEGELGRGGMATVWLARDLKHDRQVALKVMHPELAATVGPERFLREIHTTAALQHPHILPVLDSGRDAGLLWYTMPYVQGESLRRRLDRDSRLPLEMALDITRQAALALNYAHRHGVIHRDVKPENILLSDDQALVADFGSAKALLGEIGRRAAHRHRVDGGYPSLHGPSKPQAGKRMPAATSTRSAACSMKCSPVKHRSLARHLKRLWRVGWSRTRHGCASSCCGAGGRGSGSRGGAGARASRPFSDRRRLSEALASAATSPTRSLPVTEARGATPPPSAAE